MLLPGYHFPVVATFMGAPIEFVQQCQESCQFHADAISRMTRHILDMGQDPFADPLCGICIYESTKLQVIYVTCVALNHPGLWECVTQNIETNLKALHTIEKQQIKRGLYVSWLLKWVSSSNKEQLFSLCRLLKDFGFADVVSVSQQSNSPGSAVNNFNTSSSMLTSTVIQWSDKIKKIRQKLGYLNLITFILWQHINYHGKKYLDRALLEIPWQCVRLAQILYLQIPDYRWSPRYPEMQGH